MIRTIKGWCVYDPAHRGVIVVMKPLKWMAEKSKYPGCVIVEMKGTYVMPRKAKP